MNFTSLLAQKKIKDPYDFPLLNPFTLPRNGESIYLQNENENQENLFANGNAMTKKRLEESDLKKETYAQNHLNYNLFKAKKLRSHRRTSLNKILSFQTEAPEHIDRTFPLFTDKEIFSCDPYNDKVIPMMTDEDVESDEELIEKAQAFLYNGIGSAIEEKILCLNDEDENEGAIEEKNI